MPRKGGVPENLTYHKGRAKGSKNKCVKAKDDYFKVFFKLGGKKLVEDLLATSKRAKERFLLDTLPGLMPKKTEIEGSLDLGGDKPLQPLLLAARIVFLVEQAKKEQAALEDKQGE
jgi:hypothetical protein